MEVNNFICLLGIFALHLTAINSTWTQCLHLARSGILDCSGQHFDRISQTARLDVSKSEFHPITTAGQIRLLNLSKNALTSINSSSFSPLRYPESLEILDLSHNELMFISPGSFKALSQLKILLLNDNQLYALNRSSFAELKLLEELNLDANPLSSFPDRTFAALSKLRKISIMSNQLSCDCQIVDLLRFINKDEQVQVSNRTVCMFPHSLRGVQIASLNMKVLKRSCGKGNFNPAVFDLEPASRSLIVYPDSEKNITCKVSKFNDVYMEWLKNNVPVVQSSRLTITHFNDSQFLYLNLYLNPVTWEDEGDWICYVEQGGSVIRNTVRITPVLVNSVHCVQEWKADEKGEIIWPISKQGLIAAKCPSGPNGAKAYRLCKHGKWELPDTSRCTYASPFIQHFLALLQQGQASACMDELLQAQKRPSELSAYETRLVGWIIGNATGSSSRQMLAALNFVLQSEFARIELDGELIRNRLQQLLLGDQVIQEDNIATCQHLLLAKGYDGIGAEKLKDGFLASHDGVTFSCHEQLLVELLPGAGGTSLRIPRTTIDQFPSLTVVRVLWLANSNIFKSMHTQDGRWIVVDEVYGVAVKYIPLKSTKSGSNPEHLALLGRDGDDFYGFYTSYRVNAAAEQIQLAIWNDQDGWKLVNETNCLSQRAGPNYVLFTCSRKFFISNVAENMTYFAAMQNASYLELMTSSKISIKFSWWTYASFGFLASAMLSTVIINLSTYFCAVPYFPLRFSSSSLIPNSGFSLSKNRSRRRQQVIVNMCICIFILCTLYTLTGNRIHDPEGCRAVSVSQHFFFLAIYFWIMQAFRLLREKLGRAVRGDDPNKGGKNVCTEAEKVAMHGAIMEMYFIAYGIPLIAISTVLATDTSSYDRLLKFCFPSPTMHMKILACAIFAPLFICLLIILGIVITIFRLLFIVRHLSMERTLERYSDDKGAEGSSASSGSGIAPPRLMYNNAAGSATSQLMQLLLIATLYSLDCYAATVYINHSNDPESSGLTTLSTYFNALFNVSLALTIFCAFTLESLRLILRKICDPGRTTCITESTTIVPYNCKVSFSGECCGTTVPLLPDYRQLLFSESIAGYPTAAYFGTSPT